MGKKYQLEEKFIDLETTSLDEILVPKNPQVTGVPTVTKVPTVTNVPTKAPEGEYSNEETLPILYINIDESKGTIADMNNDNDHNTKCYGSISFSIPEKYQSQYGKLGIENGQELALDHIKGRGNATWHCDKKPYKIKLKEKSDFFGMGSNKHWVLLTNSYEFTYMKNKMLYDLADTIGLKYSPQSVYVDVVMNGEYLGNYLLCEQIRAGKSRVAIDDLEEEKEFNDSTITGGYLVNLDSYASMDPVHYITQKEHRAYTFESPKFEDLLDKEGKLSATAQKQYDYITDYLQRMEDAVYSPTFVNEQGERYSELMDVDSFVDYFLIQFFSDNFDAFTNSTYMYKERKGKLYWGPVWDFDHSMNQKDGTSTSVVDNNGRYMVKQILSDPYVAKKVVERYKEIKNTLTDLYASGGYIDKMAERIKVSRENDMTRWQNTYKKYYQFDDEIENWKYWMKDRIKFMDTYLPTLVGEYYTVTFTEDEKSTVVPAAKNATVELPVPQKEGAEFEGWFATVNGQEIDFTKTTLVTTDMTVTAKWKEQQEENQNSGNTENEKQPQTETQKKTYDVVLKGQGGNITGREFSGKYSSVTIPVEENDSIFMNYKAEKKGYEFTGWYTKPSKGNRVSSREKLIVSADITLYAQWKKVSVPKAKISSVKNLKGRKISVIFKKVSGSKGYEVSYATQKNFKNAKKKNVSVSAKNYTITKASKGKTYYIKVRAYKKDSTGKKIYGKYSDVKKIKISK